MKTIENNKLIAEFMGSEKPEFAKINGALINIENCAYHFSWDWLMPVVEKIESLGYDTEIAHILDDGGHIFYINDSPIQPTTKISKIQTVYQGVIDFIKYYNSNK